MNTEEKTIMSDSSKKRLRGSHTLLVLKGRQAGARVSLDVGSRVQVGTALDNEIVLYTSKQESCSFIVRSTLESIQVEVLEGSIKSGDAILDVGMVHEVKESDKFTVDETEFEFILAVREKSKKYSNSTQTPITWNKVLSSRAMTLFCISAGLLFLMSVVSTGIHRANSQPGTDPRSLVTMLESAGYGHLEYVEGNEFAPPFISGAVESREDKIAIAKLAKLQSPDVIIKLQINEELTAAVEDLYRVNGVSATATVSGLGEVEIWTSTKNINLLNLVEERIKEDLPQVVSLSTSNTVPEDAIVKSNSNIKENPDKKITLVVAGVDGYLMTKDKSRYFIGSILPSGHVVKNIEKGEVLVRRDGKELLLTF